MPCTEWACQGMNKVHLLHYSINLRRRKNQFIFFKILILFCLQNVFSIVIYVVVNFEKIIFGLLFLILGRKFCKFLKHELMKKLSLKKIKVIYLNFSFEIWI